MVFDIVQQSSEWKFDMSFTAKPSTIDSEQHVLEGFLAEMSALDHQQASTRDQPPTPRKTRVKGSIQPCKNPNPAWKRRKEELLKLRAETQTLETQVAFLRLHETHAKLYDAYVGTTEGQKHWKTVALTERQRRQQAEEENSRLKSTIKKCQKTCDTLQTALKRTSVGNMEYAMSKGVAAKSLRVEMAIGQLQPLSIAVFNMLKHRVRTRLQKLDSVLFESRALQTGADSDQDQVNCSKTPSTVEFKLSRLLPFSADKTLTVAWDVMRIGGFPNEQPAPGHSDDVSASEGCSTHPLKCGGTAELRSHCWKQRVAIPGGFAVIVESISEWCAYPASSAPWSYVTRDSGWAFVYPLRKNGSADMCRVQTMLRLSTADSDEAEYCCHQHTHSQLIDAVGEVVIPSFRDMIRSRHQLLDNTLLDNALLCSSRPPV